MAVEVFKRGADRCQDTSWGVVSHEMGKGVDTRAGEARTLPRLDILFVYANNQVDGMEVKMTSNVGILKESARLLLCLHSYYRQPTVLQHDRTPQTPARHNDLLCLDYHLSNHATRHRTIDATRPVS